MVSTIGPLVKVAKSRWLRAVTAYTCGSIVGGLLLGLPIAAISVLAGSVLPTNLRIVIATVLAIGAAIHDSGVLRLPLPENWRGLPQAWWERGETGAAFKYGVLLGFAVATVIPFASFYALLGILILVSDPRLALAACGIYGLARAIPVLLASAEIAYGAEPRRLAQSVVMKQRQTLYRLNTASSGGLAAAAISILTRV